MTTKAPKSLIEAAAQSLIRHEGYERHVYPDSLGISSIGVGFNLEQPGARELVARVGADYDALIEGRTDLTRSSAIRCSSTASFQTSSGY
jgi:GH24 family phage-related lysozyme (muramidase)